MIYNKTFKKRIKKKYKRSITSLITLKRRNIGLIGTQLTQSLGALVEKSFIIICGLPKRI
jgi:hypothetical protein